MNAFEWTNAKSVADAVRLLGEHAADKRPVLDDLPHAMGGGQDLLTTMKAYIVRPPRIVNLKTIPDANRIVADDESGVVLGATATLTDVEENAAVAKRVPGLIEAIHSVATPQIRNVGTIGGNLCQRPRCWYFRHENLKCLKRGGDTCYAKDGENKYHAAFGTDAPCVITHPSDLAPLLVAVSAVITAAGVTGIREIPAGEFFRMPTADDARRENVLAADEIVTQIRIPLTPLAGRSTYLKFKERASLDFAMASVAAAVELASDGTVQSARVVLGGLAPVPWAVPDVDAFLVGKRLDEATVIKAGELAIAGAKPLSQNAYKLPLTRTLVRRALTKLA
jgi:xanthine dehydrogenase YagS FAD-binding subunit